MKLLFSSSEPACAEGGPTRSARSWAYWFVVVTASAIGFWFLAADLLVRHPNSCRTFYHAAKALEERGDLYGSHAPGSDPQYVYPPLFALVFLPLSWLTLVQATRLWLVFNVALTLAALWAGTAELMRRFRVPRCAWTLVGVACGAFLLSVGEVKTEWATGQTDTLILLAFVLALRWLDRRPWLAGAVIGGAANIKYQTLVALPWMLARRRWTAAGTAALATLGCLLVPALVSGWVGNLHNVGIALAGLGKFLGVHGSAAAPTVDVGWERSISITSAAARLLAAARRGPAGGVVIGGCVGLAVLGVYARLYRLASFRLFEFRAAGHGRVPADEGVVAVEWIGLMVAWLAFGPEVARRHMFVLLLLHAAVLLLLVDRQARFAKKGLFIGLLVWQLGLRLPPSGMPLFQKIGDVWNGIGGPSWCLLLLYGLLIRTVLAGTRVPASEPNPAQATGQSGERQGGEHRGSPGPAAPLLTWEGTEV